MTPGRQAEPTTPPVKRVAESDVQGPGRLLKLARTGRGSSQRTRRGQHFTSGSVNEPASTLHNITTNQRRPPLLDKPGKESRAGRIRRFNAVGNSDRNDSHRAWESEIPGVPSEISSDHKLSPIECFRVATRRARLYAAKSQETSEHVFAEPSFVTLGPETSLEQADLAPNRCRVERHVYVGVSDITIQYS